ncbi:MAG: hypothetical protein ABIQ56_01110, partial [Chitinophagaceae bacterium]
NGPFTHLFNITSRLNLRTVNKKSLEALVLSGALDSLAPEIDRSQYFELSGNHESYIEHALKLGGQWQGLKSNNEMSLFNMDENLEMPIPSYPKISIPWSLVERLNKEKDITGIFVSAHPLDEYKFILDHFTTCTIANIPNYKDQPLKLAGIITKADHKISKKGTGYGQFTIEDYLGSFEFPLFSEDYLDFKNRLEVGQMVYMKAINQNSWDGTNTRFKIISIQQLASTGPGIVDSMIVQVKLHLLDGPKITKLQEILKSQKGKSNLKIVVLDMLSENYLSLISEEYKVEINTALLDHVKELGFDFILN